jgi:hypothetical protein
MRSERRSQMAGALILVTAMMCSSAAIAARVDLSRSSPVFRPEQFFEGRTTGQGVLRILIGRRHSTLVHGSGHIDAVGTLILDQDVKREGKPVEHRQWQIRKVAAGHCAGTLTDASGPIEGIVTGNLLTLRFPMKGGLRAEQKLYLSPDGQVAENFMKIRKAGIVVATLTETIRRAPASLENVR